MYGFSAKSNITPLNILGLLMRLETSRNKLKKHYFTKNCSDLSLLEKKFLEISKCLQILGKVSFSIIQVETLEKFLSDGILRKLAVKKPSFLDIFKINQLPIQHQVALQNGRKL